MLKKTYIAILISLFRVLSYWEISAQWEACLHPQWENCETQSKWYTEPYCFSKDNASNVSCMFNNLSNILIKDQKSASAKDTIEKYCNAMLSLGQNDWRIYYAKEKEDTWDWEQTFDSRQSIFVYALCSSFKDQSWKSLVKIDSDLSDIFKWDVAKILKLQQKSKGEDKCSLSVKNNNLDECDMSIYATEIFSAIMSDIFKIKYAQAFSVESSDDFSDVEERITSFFSWYFSITESYKNLKDQYPKTVDVVNSNQNYYKKVLDTLKILDNSKLADIEKEFCSSKWNIAWKDFIKCAMHDSHWRGLTLDPAFVTLFYNELLNYQIFEKTYQSRLSSKSSSNTLTDKDIRELQSKIRDFQLYANMQIDAAYKTLHDLEELNMTYPLHIWLLLYQERIKKFRDKNLSPIVTLFYSLSEKLQNVQIPNSD